MRSGDLVKGFRSVMVITEDFESSDPGSIPGGTEKLIIIILIINDYEATITLLLKYWR